MSDAPHELDGPNWAVSTYDGVIYGESEGVGLDYDTARRRAELLGADATVITIDAAMRQVNNL